MTKQLNGPLLYEDRTIQLKKGDTMRYWIADGRRQILTNRTFGVETPINEAVTPTADYDYGRATRATDYIYSIIEKFNTSSQLLEKRVPFKNVLDALYYTEDTNERQSYIDRLMDGFQSDWF